MVKKLIVVVSLFSTTFLYSQKTFEFDYVAEYQERADLHRSIIATGYKFFNSKDNSYMLSITEDTENIHMWLNLKSGQIYYDKISREDFFVEAISLKCPKTWFKNNSSYESLKDYEVSKLPDTIINTNKYNCFVVKPLNKMEIEQKKQLPEYYIVDGNNVFQFPVLNPTGLLYRKWKKDNSSIPNGIIKESFIKKEGGYEPEIHLVQYTQVKKIILIDMDCN